MCRQNQLWGWAMIAFGLGVLVGLWLQGGFFSHCFGFGVIFFGCSLLRRR